MTATEFACCPASGTPLPICLAGLGWGWTTAGIAALAGSLVAGGVLGNGKQLKQFAGFRWTASLRLVPVPAQP